MPMYQRLQDMMMNEYRIAIFDGTGDILVWASISWSFLTHQNALTMRGLCTHESLNAMFWL
jgi:hypothetical protein